MTLQQSIQKLAKQETFDSVIGKVKSVDTSKKTCIVTRVEDAPDILDVRLSAIESTDKGIIPSHVICSFVIIGNTPTDQPHVLMFSEIGSQSILINNMSFILNEDGLQLTVGSNDLKEGLQDLKTALLNL